MGKLDRLNWSLLKALIIHKKYVPYRFPHVSLIFFVSLQAEKSMAARYSVVSVLSDVRRMGVSAF